MYKILITLEILHAEDEFTWLESSEKQERHKNIQKRQKKGRFSNLFLFHFFLNFIWPVNHKINFACLIYVLFYVFFILQCAWLQIMEIIKAGGRPVIPQDLSIPSKYKDLIKELWEGDPLKRPAFKQVSCSSQYNRSIIWLWLCAHFWLLRPTLARRQIKLLGSHVH